MKVDKDLKGVKDVELRRDGAGAKIILDLEDDTEIEINVPARKLVYLMRKITEITIAARGNSYIPIEELREPTEWDPMPEIHIATKLNMGYDRDADLLDLQVKTNLDKELRLHFQSPLSKDLVRLANKVIKD